MQTRMKKETQSWRVSLCLFEETNCGHKKLLVFIPQLEYRQSSTESLSELCRKFLVLFFSKNLLASNIKHNIKLVNNKNLHKEPKSPQTTRNRKEKVNREEELNRKLESFEEKMEEEEGFFGVEFL